MEKPMDIQLSFDEDNDHVRLTLRGNSASFEVDSDTYDYETLHLLLPQLELLLNILSIPKVQ